jgi:hypothetical protein
MLVSKIRLFKSCIFKKELFGEAIERGELRSPKYQSSIDKSRVYTKSPGASEASP